MYKLGNTEAIKALVVRIPTRPIIIDPLPAEV